MILKLRITTLIIVHILILLHVYYFGSDVVGSIDFQEFFHSFLKEGVVNAGVILVFIAFLTTLLFGRFFCGWACHFGAIQEFSYYILKKLKINTITINSRLVTLLPFLILLNYYVIPNTIHLITNPPDQGITLSLNQPEIWEFLPGFFIGLLTFTIDGFFIVYFLGKKGFCRFLCPWGAFLKFPNSLAFFKVRKTGDCTHCNVCTDQCPVGIDVSYEINHYNKVTNTNCTSCLNCTTGCPSNALSYKFENPLKEKFNIKNYLFNPNMFKHPNILDNYKSIRLNDINFLIITILFSVSIDQLYGIGHFLAYGIGIIIAYTLMFSLKKLSKRIQVFLTTIIILIGLTHATIKYSLNNGERLYNELYSKRITSVISEEDIRNKSIKNLERANKLYIMNNGKRHIMLATLYLDSGNIKKAEEHAKLAAKINPNHRNAKEIMKIIQQAKIIN